MESQLGQPAAGAASACAQAPAPWGMALQRASQNGQTALVQEGIAEEEGGEKSNLLGDASCLCWGCRDGNAWGELVELNLFPLLPSRSWVFLWRACATECPKEPLM